jgi:hypothetical protein
MTVFFYILIINNFKQLALFSFLLIITEAATMNYAPLTIN